jgi:hypothetical protein
MNQKTEKKKLMEIQKKEEELEENPEFEEHPEEADEDQDTEDESAAKAKPITAAKGKGEAAEEPGLTEENQILMNFSGTRSHWTG